MRKLLNTVAFLIIFLLIILAWWLHPSKGERIASKIIAENCCIDSLNPAIDSAMVIFTAGTKYEGKWQVNEPLDNKKINLYIIRNVTDPTLISYMGNCSYVGFENIIICDYDFITRFLDNHLSKEYKQSNNAFADEQGDGLLKWIIGHEVGHVILGHSGASFNENPLDSIVSKQKIGQWQEIEADSFMLQKILIDKNHLSEVTYLLLNLLNSEIKRKTPDSEPYYGVGLTYNFLSQPAIEYSKEDSHPEYIIRAVRLLDLIGESTKDAGLTYQLSELIKNFKCAD